MLVKELIELLQKENQNAKVLVWDAYFDDLTDIVNLSKLEYLGYDNVLIAKPKF